MIRNYTPDDFPYLQQWITDADLLFLFSGPDWTFPLTEEQIRNHQLKYRDKRLYVGCDARGIPYAIGELIWNEPDSPRLGRLLIGDPGERGKGRGSGFIQELIAEFVRFLNPPEICLFVFEGNIPAIRCYEKLGFRSAPGEPKIVVVNGEEKRMHKMILSLESV